MPGPFFKGDQLLILAMAAKNFEQHGVCEINTHSKETLANYIEPRNMDTKERKSYNNRYSHNELEKRRRGYLKQCMENLKESLDLFNETTRITTLTVLKKAKLEIINYNEKNSQYEELIKRENQRSQMIAKRKFHCKKRIEDRANLKRNFVWRERRNRNFSECIIRSNTSDETLQGCHSKQQIDHPYISGKNNLHNNSMKGFGLRPQMQDCSDQALLSKNNIIDTIYNSLINGDMKSQRKQLSDAKSFLIANVSQSYINEQSNTRKEKSHDGSSSDSGFEDISLLTPNKCIVTEESSSPYSITKANQLIHQQATSALFYTGK